MNASSTRRILITGASGFVGRAALSLPVDGEVHAVSRQARPASDRIRWHQADLLDADRMTYLIRDVQPTHLLHLAWDVAPGKYWTSENNFHWVQAGLHLMDVFQQYGGQRAVFAGTCAEYDWRYGYFVEDLHPLSDDTPYAVCKSSLYRMVSSYARQTGLSLAWGRIFFPFGPHEHPSRLIPYVIQTLMQDQIAETTSGEQIRDFMYVGDVASAFIALLQSDVQGAVNIASGQPVKLKDIILTIAHKLGKADLVRLGARPDGDQPPMIVGDKRRLHDEVGWSPAYTLEQGLDASIQWWKEQL